MGDKKVSGKAGLSLFHFIGQEAEYLNEVKSNGSIQN
jgi:hypothetical protein